ncbi:MAG: hypothetical protein MK135_07780, partial [Polyangiaceae bacterium]|nr:hypothetical protein [Polyangiaceae bacterium]
VKDEDGKEKDYSWPESFEIPDGKKKVKLERYIKGDPISRRPKVIPVDPGSQAAVCPADTLSKLRREVVSLEKTLKGDRSNPANEKPGLADMGKSLMDKLKDIGG